MEVSNDKFILHSRGIGNEKFNILLENTGGSHSHFFLELHWLTHCTMERCAGNRIMDLILGS